MDKLRLDEIYQLRKSIERLPSTEIGEIVRYYFTNTDYFLFLGARSNEMRIYKDNYPRQKQFFSSNLPINSEKDLEYNLGQCGVQLKRIETFENPQTNGKETRS